MQPLLHEAIGKELRRRHGLGMMEGKLKPVHVANALMRAEHGTVGRMSDLKLLMTATAAKETPEARLRAAQKMVETSRDRWGRLGEEQDLRQSLLVTHVLPLLRTILATDAAAFGTSPDQSSFSSPTALTVTGDPSDDHAGEFIHRLWSGLGETGRLEVLDLFRDVSASDKSVADVDDLTAVLIPLADETRPPRLSDWTYQDLTAERPSAIAGILRAAAADLGTYEKHARPNPIASLQRIVTLASISIFFHAASRAAEWGGMPPRLLLLDASGTKHSPVADASELLVMRLMDDSRSYMAKVLADILAGTGVDWTADPGQALAELARSGGKKSQSYDPKILAETLAEITDTGSDVAEELPLRLVELLDGSSGRSLDGFLRLFGVRSGLLYPQQKNPNKRLVPADRTLEVLVISTFDTVARQLEFRDFLAALHRRWGIVVGGRPEDAVLLSEAGATVDSASLAENSERFLTRLEALGLARRLADSVAVVGVMENERAHG